VGLDDSQLKNSSVEKRSREQNRINYFFKTLLKNAMASFATSS